MLMANMQLVDDAIKAVNSLLATGMDWDHVQVTDYNLTSNRTRFVNCYYMLTTPIFVFRK